MPVFTYPDGFPLRWGNLSPQNAARIIQRQTQLMISDLAVNQVPGGRVDEIPFKQIVKPIQPKAEGISAGELNEYGKYGSNLYDQFMNYYEPKKGSGTP